MLSDAVFEDGLIPDRRRLNVQRTIALHLLDYSKYRRIKHHSTISVGKYLRYFRGTNEANSCDSTV
jgi:hypothetical protein